MNKVQLIKYLIRKGVLDIKQQSKYINVIDNGNVILSGYFNLNVSKNKYDQYQVNIYWEENIGDDYKNYGVFGCYNTYYNDFKLDETNLIITSPNNNVKVSINII